MLKVFLVLSYFILIVKSGHQCVTSANNWPKNCGCNSHGCDSLCKSCFPGTNLIPPKYETCEKQNFCHNDCMNSIPTQNSAKFEILEYAIPQSIKTITLLASDYCPEVTECSSFAGKTRQICDVDQVRTSDSFGLTFSKSYNNPVEGKYTFSVGCYVGAHDCNSTENWNKKQFLYTGQTGKITLTVCSYYIENPILNHQVNVQKVDAVDDGNNLTINEKVVTSNFPCDCLNICVPSSVSSHQLIDDMQVTDSFGSAHPDLNSQWNKPNINIWAINPTVKKVYYYYLGISVAGALRTIQGPYYYEVKCMNVQYLNPDGLTSGPGVQSVVISGSFSVGEISPEYTLPQTVESQNTACPIQTYITNMQTPPAQITYPQSGCNSPANSAECKKITIADTTAPTTFTVRWNIMIEGNTNLIYIDVQIKIKCGGEISPYKPQGEPEILKFIQKDQTNSEIGEFVMEEFYFSDIQQPNCFIQSYTLNPTNTNFYWFKRNSCTASSGSPLSKECRTVNFIRTEIDVFSFTIDVIGTDSTTSVSPQIYLYIGCQSQAFVPNITFTNLTQQYFVGQPNTFVDYIVEDKGNFTMETPNDHCQIELYEAKWSATTTGLIQLGTDCSNFTLCQTVRMDTSAETFYQFSFDIISNAKPAYQLLKIPQYNVSIVCGGQVQSVSQRNVSYVFPANTTGNSFINFTQEGISKMFSSNIKACDISKFSLSYENRSYPIFNQSNIQLHNSENIKSTYLEVATGYGGFKQDIYIISYVKDKPADYGLMVQIIVCGLEVLDKRRIQPYNFQIVQTRHDLNVTITDYELKQMFFFDSYPSSLEFCNNKTLDLYLWSNLTERYVKPEPYSSENITYPIELITTLPSMEQKIVIHTTKVVNRTTLYIGRVTRGKRQKEVAISVWIQKRIENFRDPFNYPPQFLTILKSKQVFDIIDTPQNQSLKFEIQLPDIDDDREQFDQIKIESKSLGFTSWKNGLSPMISQFSKIKYDKNNNRIEIKFKDYYELVNANGTHNLKIELSDQQNHKQEYEMQILFIKEIIIGKHNEMVKVYTPINTNLTANIKSFNQYGDLVIKFSDLMNTTQGIYGLNSSNSMILDNESDIRNLTVFNDLIEIYVEPADERNIYDENFEIQQVNLTWHATNFSGEILDIFVNFLNVSYLSPLPEQDRLIVKINPNQNLFKTVDMPIIYLSANSTHLETRIPKQIKLTDAVALVNKSSENTKDIVLAALIFYVLMNSIFANSFKYMISMINALAFIFHLPIMNIIHPAIVMNVFNIMIPIVMFDVVEDVPQVQEFVERFASSEEESTWSIRDQMIDLGYQTTDPVLLLKTLMILQVLYFLRLAFLLAILLPFKIFLQPGNLKIRVKKYYGELKNTLFFSEILAIYFGSIIELIIAGYLQLNTSKEDPSNTFLNKLVSIYFILIPSLLIPGLFFWMFTNTVNRIKSQKFQNRWGVLTSDLSMKRPSQMTFYLVYNYRRCIFVILSIIFDQTQVLQVVGLLLLNLTTFIYGINIQPFKGRFRNRVEIFNEIGVVNLSFFLCLFTPFVTNPETQDKFGWMMVILCLIFMGINFAIALYFIVNVIKIFIIKYNKLIRYYYKKLYKPTIKPPSMEDVIQIAPCIKKEENKIQKQTPQKKIKKEVKQPPKHKQIRKQNLSMELQNLPKPTIKYNYHQSQHQQKFQTQLALEQIGKLNRLQQQQQYLNDYYEIQQLKNIHSNKIPQILIIKLQEQRAIGFWDEK